MITMHICLFLFQYLQFFFHCYIRALLCNQLRCDLYKIFRFYRQYKLASRQEFNGQIPILYNVTNIWIIDESFHNLQQQRTLRAQSWSHFKYLRSTLLGCALARLNMTMVITSQFHISAVALKVSNTCVIPMRSFPVSVPWYAVFNAI